MYTYYYQFPNLYKFYNVYFDFRVLIFTQMTRMLDVLERFLNYHGFIYVRLDGSTKVDQRQVSSAFYFVSRLR